MPSEAAPRGTPAWRRRAAARRAFGCPAPGCSAALHKPGSSLHRLRSAILTRPDCDPCQRTSPLAFPGVRGPAISSALSFKIVSSVCKPIAWTTVSTTWLALWIRFNNGSRICPLAWQNCSITAADSRSARVTIWYAFFTAVRLLSDSCLSNRILSKPGPPPYLNLQLRSGHAPGTALPVSFDRKSTSRNPSHLCYQILITFCHKCHLTGNGYCTARTVSNAERG